MPEPSPPPLRLVGPVDGQRPAATDAREEKQAEERLPFAVERTPDEETAEEKVVSGDIDEMLVARTPLLVRAFAGSVIERDE